MQQRQHVVGGRLSTSSISKNVLLNGLIPPHRLSQTAGTIPSLTPSQSPNQSSRIVTNSNNQLKRSEIIKYILLILLLTILFALLLITIFYFGTRIVKKDDLFINSTKSENQTNSNHENYFLIRSFFACVWFFNVSLFFICLFIHLILYRQRSQHGRARAAFLREFGRIFNNGKLSSTNTLVDYLIKTCLLCILWYLSCYLMFRSMSILESCQIIIIYSIRITLRQVLGWIFLHEEFIGNKIIAHILALSSLLFLAHDDGFRFNQFLFGLAMLTSAVVMRTIFDVLINGFIKEITSSKLRMVMINVCLCGTCLLWPFALLFHITQIESIQIQQFNSLIITITLFCALLLNILTISIPYKYTSISTVTALLIVIPSISLIDRYVSNIKHSPLVISAILCSFVGVFLSIIPKQWFQAGEAAKMKQALGLINKDANTNAASSLLNPSGTTTGTSTAFEEIRAQRRIRNALLFNEHKT